MAGLSEGGLLTNILYAFLDSHIRATCHAHLKCLDLMFLIMSGEEYNATESYPAFALIGLSENPGKNFNQVNCPDRDSNPGHLVLRPDALTVTPQLWIGAATSFPLLDESYSVLGFTTYTVADIPEHELRDVLYSIEQRRPLEWLIRLRHSSAGLKLHSDAGSIPAWADYPVRFFPRFSPAVSYERGSRMQSLVSTVKCWGVYDRNWTIGLVSGASPTVDMWNTCKVYTTEKKNPGQTHGKTSSRQLLRPEQDNGPTPLMHYNDDDDDDDDDDDIL
ncbi:hypothetical protein ANN_17820 [Periplaneta americana]|uniref:Uncharacterized protein n=1 Tax=Periplaneta americana TaxID=6978 RepID=A0ABQ8SVB9_PERAM|nr:hypothetical protein ANN_17820 [Periplaneta americana]